MLIDWSIHITPAPPKIGSSNYKIIRAQSELCIIFIYCSSWEEAQRIRDDAFKSANEKGNHTIIKRYDQ